jgi:hypothetical protein
MSAQQPALIPELLAVVSNTWPTSRPRRSQSDKSLILKKIKIKIDDLQSPHIALYVNTDHCVFFSYTCR